MDDLTLISCSYNTPDVTLAMLKSWMYVHNRTQKCIICDCSTNNDTKILLEENNVPYVSFPGMTHGTGVNELIRLCKTKYALLVDTDVVFLQDHNKVFQQFKEMDLTIMGKVEGDRGGKAIYNRVNPWHCFINVSHIKDSNITFFDEERMKKSLTESKIYDVGSTFFEDVKQQGYKIGNVDLSKSLFFHFEGMSWYKNKFDSTKEDTGIDFGGTHNNPGYVYAYEEKYKAFKTIEQQYKDTSIQDRYINRDPQLLVKFPTRGRVDRFFKTLDRYYQLLSGKYRVKFFITCDEDDTTMNNSVVKNRLKKYSNLEVEFGNSKTKIEAINSSIENKNFDILLLASDDMIPIEQGYDQIIIDSMCRSFSDFDGIVWFNDGVQQNRLNTLCILGRKYYNRFGYIYNPEYKSLWCDAEFTLVGNMLGRQKYFDHIIIKHEHHSVTGENLDSIYVKNETYENEDRETFLRRKSKQFELFKDEN